GGRFRLVQNADPFVIADGFNIHAGLRRQPGNRASLHFRPPRNSGSLPLLYCPYLGTEARGILFGLNHPSFCPLAKRTVINRGSPQPKKGKQACKFSRVRTFFGVTFAPTPREIIRRPICFALSGSFS